MLLFQKFPSARVIQKIKKLPEKIKKIIGFLWGKTPPFLRQKIVRSTQKKFTVSVAAIVLNEKGEVLLLNHILRPYYNWGMPGGFINHSEQPADALRRELREETGIELENVEMLRIRTLHRHIEILFRADGIGKAEVKSHEIFDVGWFRTDNLPEGLSGIQKIFIRNFLDSGF